MKFRNSQALQLRQTGLVRCLRHRVHVAGIAPNHMNRFLHTNSQEVLFVI